MTQTFTAYEDNAGGTHISDGTTAWFLGFDYDQSNLRDDIAAWAAGEWEPNEGDGQTPESMDQYEVLADSTECHELILDALHARATYQQVVDALTAEGYAPETISSAIDAFIAIDDVDEWTADDVQVLRDQMDSATGRES